MATTTALATEQSKEFALRRIAQRRKQNKGKPKIDNSSLPAGSPMYFYCIGCGEIADTLPETYIPSSSSPKKFCGECQALKDMGWLE